MISRRFSTILHHLSFVLRSATGKSPKSNFSIHFMYPQWSSFLFTYFYFHFIYFPYPLLTCFSHLLNQLSRLHFLSSIKSYILIHFQVFIIVIIHYFTTLKLLFLPYQLDTLLLKRHLQLSCLWNHECSFSYQSSFAIHNENKFIFLLDFPYFVTSDHQHCLLISLN